MCAGGVTISAMESRACVKRVNGHGGAPLVELHLSRDVFATGRRLSGVVVVRLSRPTNIRSLIVSVSGVEVPTGAALVRALRRSGSFFDRDMLLSGAIQPRLASDRMSLLWNAILGRYTGRRLSPGEHTYPFSIPLPASLPPSYEGRAGRIDYRVSARLQLAIGRVIKATAPVPVVFVPRMHRGRPVALSYPTADGTVHSTEISVSLEMPQRTVALGDELEGRFIVNNPQGVEVPRVTVGLELCEWVRLSVEKEIQRERVDMYVIKPEDTKASSFEAAFKLRVPKSASPTVEGTAISVIWLLKLTLETNPPLEFKTPITVYAPTI